MFQTNLNGIDLHYQVRGEGTPLFLLHGFTGSSADWAHVFPADPPGRLIIPDLRGHGRTGNQRWPLTHRQCADDLLALADHLGVQRFRAVGVSLGANVLLHAATRQPERIEAMVLVAATPYLPAPARAIQRAFAADDQPAAAWAEMRARHHLGDEQIRALWRQINAFADSHDDLAFTPPLLATIRARTLIVNGDRDPLYPIRLSLEMYEAIPGASLWVIPGGGHAPIYAEWREAFARTALAFLGA
jgi:pimeloyl-ACP methyl ester carboxylesterase